MQPNHWLPVFSMVVITVPVGKISWGLIDVDHQRAWLLRIVGVAFDAVPFLIVTAGSVNWSFAFLR